MLSKKLGISYPWLSRSIEQDYFGEKWIRDFIRGLFENYNYVVSDVFIHIYPKKISLKFLVFISKNNKNSRYCVLYLERLVAMTKSVLSLRFNKNVSVSIRIINDAFEDSSVLSKLLEKKISSNPFRYRVVLKRLMDSFRKKGYKPVWWRVLENRMVGKKGKVQGAIRARRSDSLVIKKLKDVTVKV